jgi:hypothetical protein
MSMSKQRGSVVDGVTDLLGVITSRSGRFYSTIRRWHPNSAGKNISVLVMDLDRGCLVARNSTLDTPDSAIDWACEEMEGQEESNAD